MSKIPLPVDLNELRDRERQEEIKPGPIGFAPKKYRSSLPLENDMARVVAEINSAVRLPEAAKLPENMEQILHELNDLVVASIETMINEANNLKAETTIWLDKLNADVREKLAAQSALGERLRTFGKAVLEAHNTYHGDQK